MTAGEATPPTTVIHDDACVLGIVRCPQDHDCVPFTAHRLGAVCVRSCDSNNGGCGDQQVCVERPYCELCELRRVMNGHCEDHGDDGRRNPGGREGGDKIMEKQY